MIVAGQAVECQCEELADEAKLVDWVLTSLLSVHLLAMNLASAGPLVGIWLRGKANPGELRHETGRALAWLSIGALLLGIFLGTVQWFFARSSGLGDAIARLPERALWFAALELGFSLLCLLGCAWCWSAQNNRRWLHAVFALLSSTNLLYHFPPLMSVLSRVATDATWARVEVLDRAALLPLMQRAEVVALTVHFALASIAVSAVVVLWRLSKVNADKFDWGNEVTPISRGAAWIALGATLTQVPVGVWLTVSLPKSELSAMMGSQMVASLSFFGALLLTFVLMQRLLTIAIGEVTPQALLRVAWVLALLVLLMTATLRGTREHERENRQVSSTTKTASMHKYTEAVES